MLEGLLMHARLISCFNFIKISTLLYTGAKKKSLMLFERWVFMADLGNFRLHPWKILNCNYSI